MKTINCFQDLQPYGINPLTGEACGLGYRILCDVTEQGRALLSKALGVPMTLARSWNGGTAVGSIMLPYEMLVPIAVFALLENGCKEVYLADGVYGIELGDSSKKVEMIRHFHGREPRRLAYRGTAGDRNRHEMSGRVE